MFRVRHSEAVRQVRHFPTHLRKMAKCMIYIGSYACGECYGNSFTPFTPSPRRSRPLGGSVINGTIQQLLDTHHGHPTGQFVHPQVGGVPNSATQPRNVVSSTRTRQGTPSARTAPHSAPTWFPLPGHPRAPTAPHSRATWLHPRVRIPTHPIRCSDDI